jgi:hypothetical protein
MRRNDLRMRMVVAGAMGLALTCAALDIAGKASPAGDTEKYDVAIARGRAARAPIS